MIARIWHGWTSVEKANDYENLLRSEVLPGIGRIQGYKGVFLLRNNEQSRVAFVTVTLWDSLNAIREFAGDDYEKAVVPPEARRLLSEFDDRSKHYDILIAPKGS